MIRTKLCNVFTTVAYSQSGSPIINTVQEKCSSLKLTETNHDNKINNFLTIHVVVFLQLVDHLREKGGCPVKWIISESNKYLRNLSKALKWSLKTPNGQGRHPWHGFEDNTSRRPALQRRTSQSAVRQFILCTLKVKTKKMIFFNINSIRKIKM